MKMENVEVMRALVNERLNAVAEEIVDLFAKTIAEYQDNISRLVEETERQRRQLDTLVDAGGPSRYLESQQVLSVKDAPRKQQKRKLSLDQEYVCVQNIKEEQEEIWSSQEGEQLQGVEKFTFSGVALKSESQEEESHNWPYISKVLHGDFQQLLGSNEEVPSEQQEWNPVLKQEDPQPPQTEVEQENLWRSLNQEEHMELEGNSATKFSVVAVLVKSKFCEEEAQSTQLHKRQTEKNVTTEPSVNKSSPHMKTESDGQEFERAEPSLLSASAKTSDSSNSETEDSDDDWKRATKKKSHFKVVMGNKSVRPEPAKILVRAPVSEDKTSDSSDADTEDSDNDLMKSKGTQAGLAMGNIRVVTVSSSKIPTEKKSLSQQHWKNHTDKNIAGCLQPYVHKSNMDTCVRTNSAERHLNGSVSKKCKDSVSLKAQHIKDKYFICSSCDKTFKKKAHLDLHIKTHKRKA